MQQRPIHKIGVTNHPSNICRAEVGFASSAAKDMIDRGGQCDRISAHISLDSLGFSCGSGGVENVRSLVGFQPFRLDLASLHLLNQIAIEQVSSIAQR